MENKLTPELIEKAKQAKSAKELLDLAKENGIELLEEEVETYFGRMNQSGELQDEELCNVSGGGCSSFNVCPACEYPLDNIDGQWVCRACGRTF